MTVPLTRDVQSELFAIGWKTMLAFGHQAKNVDQTRPLVLTVHTHQLSPAFILVLLPEPNF